MPRLVDWRKVGRRGAAIVVALAACTLAALALENGLGLPDASAVYLLGVAGVAIRWGATPAIATAVGAFLAYNFGFVEPRYTFSVANPEQFLNLVLFLVIGSLIGRLAGQERDREQLASRREREALALSAISRALATEERLESAALTVARRLAEDARMDRVWMTVADGGRERPLADSQGEQPRPDMASYAMLRRSGGEVRPAWRRIHQPHRRPAAPPDSPALYRVDLVVGDEPYGALWGERGRGLPEPTAEETRLLEAAADQVAQAVRRQQLARTAAEVEIARRSDRAKTALLDSVSHDLRTPLATIRAAAGSLVDPDLELADGAAAELGSAIDREADRLNRLVTNLLDMSRIESGAIRPDLELVPVATIVDAVVDRLGPSIRAYPLEVDLPEALPVSWADPLMLDQVLTNLLENVVRYVPPGAALRIRGLATPGAAGLSLIVEDGGLGVAGDPGRLFDKFRREAHPGEGARRGTGLGLAVVRGLAEAMGGSVDASRSELGGLAVTVHLQTEPAGMVDAGSAAPLGAER